MARPRAYDLAAVPEMLKAGLSLNRIARVIGCSSGLVSYHCKRHGLPVRQPSRPVVDVETFEAGWRSGLPLRELGTQWGCSAAAICIRALRQGLPGRMPGWWL